MSGFFGGQKKPFATYIFPLPPTDPHNICLRMTQRSDYRELKRLIQVAQEGTLVRQPV